MQAKTHQSILTVNIHLFGETASMSTSTLVKRSTLTLGVVSLIGLSSLFDASPSYAAITNGGFETGTFAGFSTRGNTSIRTAAFGSGPTERTSQALLTSLAGSVSDSDLEAFLGLAAGSLDGLGNGDATEGSAIKQTFGATAGQVLTFDFNFLTNELTPAFFNDFAFVTIDSLSELADTFSTFVLSPTLFDQETGFNTFSFTIPTTGTFTLGLGVTDVFDTAVDSGLLVDNISLSSTVVPEPASVLGLLAFSALGVGSTLKRKQQQKA